jgi:exodeoxyribonuclease-5
MVIKARARVAVKPRETARFPETRSVPSLRLVQPSRWSPQQDQALNAITRWLRGGCARPVFLLFGYAGTGKTDIIREIGMGRSGTHFCSFTGKAAEVLRQRGCAPVTTIHRLIYAYPYDKERQRHIRTLKTRVELADVKLIVVDEGSMVDEELGRDLLSFGIPILVGADPEQLPPINGDALFMDADPDVMLTEIHRQARQSAIIRLADNIRRGGPLPPRGFRDGGVTISGPDVEPEAFDVVLVGTNNTRWRWINRLRRSYGFRGPVPEAGETVVCLKNDYRVTEPVFNGAQFQVLTSDMTEHNGIPAVDLILKSNYNGGSAVTVPVSSFRGKPLPPQARELQHFDYGYALTVHKAQGSEWPKVLLIDEGRCFRDAARRWTYTGITRAQEEITIVV